MNRQTKLNFRHFISLLTLALAVLVVTPVVASDGASKKDPAYYDLQVKVEKVDGQTIAVIRAVGKNGYHCNTSYPWKLKITENEKLQIEKTVFKKGDAAKFGEDEVVFRVPYKAPKGVQVKATLKLSFCDDKQCQMKSVPISW